MPQICLMVGTPGRRLKNHLRSVKLKRVTRKGHPASFHSNIRKYLLEIRSWRISFPLPPENLVVTCLVSFWPGRNRAPKLLAGQDLLHWGFAGQAWSGHGDGHSRLLFSEPGGRGGSVGVGNRNCPWPYHFRSSTPGQLRNQGQEY